jgi:hypothetical protein
MVGYSGDNCLQLHCRLKIKLKGENMLWSVFIVLLLLWFIGIVSSNTLGGFIHILLIAAVVIMIISIIGRKNPIE